jgi:hypothetical protein
MKKLRKRDLIGIRDWFQGIGTTANQMGNTSQGVQSVYNILQSLGNYVQPNAVFKLDPKSSNRAEHYAANLSREIIDWYNGTAAGHNVDMTAQIAQLAATGVQEVDSQLRQGSFAFGDDAPDTELMGPQIPDPEQFGLAPEQAAAIVDAIEEARDGDQNSLAMILENEEAATNGDPDDPETDNAAAINGFVQLYVTANPVPESGDGAMSPAFGAADHERHPSHPRHAKSAHGKHPHKAHAEHMRHLQRANGGGGGGGGGGGSSQSTSPTGGASMQSAAKEIRDAAKKIANKYGVGADHALRAAHAQSAMSYGFGMDTAGMHEMEALHNLAQAIQLSHGPLLTHQRIGEMTASFGSDEGADLFLHGIENPRMVVKPGPRLSRLAADCVKTGQCVGLARQYQAVRDPRIPIGVLSPAAHSELSPRTIGATRMFGRNQG